MTEGGGVVVNDALVSSASHAPTSQWRRSTLARLLAFATRLLFALFVTGGALPAGGPSAVHGYDIVEEDEHTQSSSMQLRSSRLAKRSSPGKGRSVFEIQIPTTIEPTREPAPPQTWMWPRRAIPPDDDDQSA